MLALWRNIRVQNEFIVWWEKGALRGDKSRRALILEEGEKTVSVFRDAVKPTLSGSGQVRV